MSQTTGALRAAAARPTPVAAGVSAGNAYCDEGRKLGGVTPFASKGDDAILGIAMIPSTMSG
jgi:hypothetical protein